MMLKGLTAALMVALLTCAGAGAALAQTPTPMPAPAPRPEEEPRGDFTGDVELTRAAIQVRRQALVTAAMDLESKEADAFWPLYREYRLAMAEVNDRFVKLLVGYLEAHDSLTDEAATKMLNEYLSIDRARNGVKTRFVPRFSKVMPPRKVARFYQVDNKLDAFLNAELARTVPLAR
jgi:hypothetical protein